MEETVILEMEVFFTDGKSRCFEISDNCLGALLRRMQDVPESNFFFFNGDTFLNLSHIKYFKVLDKE